MNASHTLKFHWLLPLVAAALLVLLANFAGVALDTFAYTELNPVASACAGQAGGC